jgi:phage terminase large subunit
MIIGDRSAGKSYSAKKKVVKKFLEAGDEFIYLRRYEDELKETKEQYFDDVLFNREFDGLNLKYDTDCYMINDRLAGY